MGNELNLENVEPEVIFEVQNNELSFDAPKSSGSGTKDYEKLENKPSINGVVLEGNKTPEELGIKAGSNVNVLPIFDINTTFEEEDVYSANIINGLTKELLGMIEPQHIFDVSCTISLSTMTVSNISTYSARIIEEKNKGKIVRMNCSFTENPLLKVSVLLDVIEGNVASFYPLIVGNIGAGEKNYLFWLQIRASDGNITARALAEERQIEEIITNINAFAKDVEQILVGFNNRIHKLETVATELEEI
jgi:hypothetical protein